MIQSPSSYSYNSLDQLLSNGTSQYSYDARGNLVQVSGGTSYSWDAVDRMTSATVSGGSASYGYDADGRRVKQTLGSTVTNYLWDEQSAYGDVVYESDGTTNTSYVLGGSEILSQKKGGTVSYFLKDGQGSVRNLANSSGSITESYRFDAYGSRAVRVLQLPNTCTQVSNLTS